MLPLKSIQTTNKIDFSKAPSCRKQPQTVTKKVTSFTETVLARVQENEEYKKFIGKNFENGAIKTKPIRLLNSNSLGNTRNVVMPDGDIFSKKPTTEITDIDYLETMLKEIDDFNKVKEPAGKTVDATIKTHAKARVLLFYNLSAAYYQTDQKNIRFNGAHMQMYRGGKEGFEACHHALFPQTTDTFFNDLINKVTQEITELTKNGKNIDETILLLLSLGIKNKEIDTYIDKAKEEKADIKKLTDDLLKGTAGKKSILNDNNLLYFMHNHTMIASSHLNRVDEMIEQKVAGRKTTREEAEGILRDVAQSSQSPLAGTKQLCTSIEAALSDSAKALTALEGSAKKIHELAEQIIKKVNSTARPEQLINDVRKDLNTLKDELENHEKIVFKHFSNRMLLADYKSLIKEIMKFKVFTKDKDADAFSKYFDSVKEFEEEKSKKSDSDKEKIENIQKELIAFGKTGLLQETQKRIKETLVPKLQRLQETTHGKYLNPDSIKKQRDIIQLQLAGTQEVSLALKKVQEPTEYLPRKLEALMQAVIARKM